MAKLFAESSRDPPQRSTLRARRDDRGGVLTGDEGVVLIHVIRHVGPFELTRAGQDVRGVGGGVRLDHISHCENF